MFGLTHSEHSQIINAVQAVLACSDKDKVVINFSDLCEHLNCAQTNAVKTILIEEIRDLLSAHNTVNLFGLWVLTELDNDIYLFAQVSKPGQKCFVSNLLLDGNVAAFQFKQWVTPARVGRKNVEMPNVYGPVSEEPAEVEG